jgi:hypothetical protein
LDFPAGDRYPVVVQSCISELQAGRIQADDVSGVRAPDRVGGPWGAGKAESGDPMRQDVRPKGLGESRQRSLSSDGLPVRGGLPVLDSRRWAPVRAPILVLPRSRSDYFIASRAASSSALA